MASEVISTEPVGSPAADLNSSWYSAIKKDADERMERIDQELFEENKEWCEQYRCKYERGFWGGVKAYVAKMLDKLIAFALDIIYGLLDALAIVINSALTVVEEILTFLCYLYKFVTTFSGSAKTYYDSCGDCSTLIQMISEFVKMICDGILALYNLIMDIIFGIVKLYESLIYECECLKVDEEQDEEKKEAVEGQEGNRASAVETVSQVPPLIEVGETANPSTGDTAQEPKHYVVVGDDSPVPSTWFKKHVQHTVEVYNFNPGCDAFIGLSTWTWKTYVWFLVYNWLSLSNLQSDLNPEGTTWELYEAEVKYCEKNMPETLFVSVLSYIVSGDF
jgi:hypothetical protein